MRIARALPALLLAGAVAAGAQDDRAAWLSADPDYRLAFPRDHASHPDYRIEWWYYTGNLDAPDGRRFGYQLTFFRVGVDRRPVNPSRWAVRDLHMAHLAVTDIAGRRHQVAERLNRDGVGWAGASTETLHVWNDGWSARLDAAAGDGAHLLNAASDDGALAVDFRLVPDRPPVLHGAAGYSQKGAETGNASHYYSFTRLRTTGRIVVDGEAFDVSGLSWMDHEFGTSFLEPAQVGWDWFSLQFDDGSDLMVYTMRRDDGAPDPRSSGTFVAPDGSITRLAAGDYALVPGRRWTSPASGASYPVAWEIRVPALGIDLDVEATIDAQELQTGESTGVTYWEGAIDARGTREGAPLAGQGYLEMTGYAGPPMSRVLR